MNNLLLSLLNTFVIRMIPPLSAAGVANYAENNHLGLFNAYPIPTFLEYLIVVILLDLLIYWQHFAFHHVPVLWRFHKVHHADHDLDASSGLRFHPVEILCSMLLKCLAVLLLGATKECVILFEIILNGCSIFSHSNLKLPGWLDRCLRWLLVTPDMHRIHHSIHRDETERNYGFNIVWWDRMFGTYQSEPHETQEQMRLGVPEFPRTDQTVPLWSMLKMPFTNLSTVVKGKNLFF